MPYTNPPMFSIPDRKIIKCDLCGYTRMRQNIQRKKANRKTYNICRWCTDTFENAKTMFEKHENAKKIFKT